VQAEQGTLLQLPVIAPATAAHHDGIWAALEPVLRAGEAYALPRDWSRSQGLAYWFAPSHEVFVALDGDAVLGSYFVMTNQQGGGAHVANCGYLTAPAATGRGIARAMCAHSLERARERGFRAMQFNFVVATNAPAVHLWQAMGFAIVGRLPGAFAHPTLGDVDALVMYRAI
jgi:ribosomal protein S18 acetylase RimI-like enzyme